jgi:triosephosphate isomerase (TIM)
MEYFFVNLKRFDVSADFGGICPEKDSSQWISTVIRKTIDLKLPQKQDLQLAYILPESLLITASDILNSYNSEEVLDFSIGCQGVYRQDVQLGGNFGAFTSNLPASAAAEAGCRWAMIGHSEERQSAYELLSTYDKEIPQNPQRSKLASHTINTIMGEETARALNRNLNILFCIGETALEKGEGSFTEQKSLIKQVLSEQLELGLKDIEKLEDRQIVIGYEPRWAIGPGKTPPGAEYIDFVGKAIKDITGSLIGKELPVVYGGGLKRENAAEVASSEHITGGLVALTKFTPPIAFDVEELNVIIDLFIEQKK